MEAIAIPQWYQVESWIITWAPIIFMGLLVFFIWRTMKLMPRTKPQQIKPESASSIGWAEVAGADEAKAELAEVVEFLRDPARFHALGAQVPKGILLHGPPGTGKTLLAKAVAHESGAQFFSQSAASFVEMFAGLGAARIRRLFAEARKARPAIIFIDELDAVGAAAARTTTPSASRRSTSCCVEMDGFHTTGDLVVIAASNLLEKLDPALLRPGRFDRQILVSPPDVAGREAILKVHTRNKPLGDDVDLATLARQTSGLAGADLANICNEAAIFAAARPAPSCSMRLRRRRRARRRRHAVAPHAQRARAPRRRVARGRPRALRRAAARRRPRAQDLDRPARQRARLHANLPEEDRYLKTREELIDYMTVLLGGRVAEEIVFGAVTTGASNDLHRVAEISRSMIHEYAMGTSITSRKVSAHGGEVSDRTRELRDEEQQHLADEAKRAAMRLIAEHREKLDEMAAALLRNEVLERADIDRIMAGTPRFKRAGAACAWSPPRRRRARRRPEPLSRRRARRRSARP